MHELETSNQSFPGATEHLHLMPSALAVAERLTHDSAKVVVLFMFRVMTGAC